MTGNRQGQLLRKKNDREMTGVFVWGSTGILSQKVNGKTMGEMTEVNLNSLYSKILKFQG